MYEFWLTANVKQVHSQVSQGSCRSNKFEWQVQKKKVRDTGIDLLLICKLGQQIYVCIISPSFSCLLVVSHVFCLQL